MLGRFELLLKSWETLKFDVGSVVTMEAQREERGRRSATNVKQRLPASGKLVGAMYSRMANMAL